MLKPIKSIGIKLMLATNLPGKSKRQIICSFLQSVNNFFDLLLQFSEKKIYKDKLSLSLQFNQHRDLAE